MSAGRDSKMGTACKDSVPASVRFGDCAIVTDENRDNTRSLGKLFYSTS